MPGGLSCILGCLGRLQEGSDKSFNTKSSILSFDDIVADGTGSNQIPATPVKGNKNRTSKTLHKRSQSSIPTVVTDDHIPNSVASAAQQLPSTTTTPSPSPIHKNPSISQFQLQISEKTSNGSNVEKLPISSIMNINGSGSDTTNSVVFEFAPPSCNVNDPDLDIANTLQQWGSVEATESWDKEHEVKKSDHSWDESIFKYRPPSPCSSLSSKRSMIQREDSSTSCFSEFAREPKIHDLKNFSLSHLQRLIKQAKAGDVFNLNNELLQEKGSLVIKNSGINIQNGNIMLSGCILINAPDVQFSDCIINCSTSRSAIRVTAKNCTMFRCKITNHYGTGLEVSGRAAWATLYSCKIIKCNGNCVWINRGAGAEITENSEIAGDQSFHGIHVEHKDSCILLTHSKVKDCCENGIYVNHGGTAELSHCEISGSKELCGVSAKRFDSFVKISNCTITKNSKAGIMLSQGAKAEVYDSRICNSLLGHLVIVHGMGTSLKFVKCEVLRSFEGIIGMEGASLVLEECDVRGFREGNGITVTGHGTHAKLVKTQVSNNLYDGIHVYQEANAEVIDSCINSCNYNGIVARGKDTKIQIVRTKICGNNSCNVYVERGASAVLDSCQINDNRQGPNVLAKGKPSMVKVIGDVEDPILIAYVSIKGAKIICAGNDCGAKRWPRKLSKRDILRSRISLPSIFH